MTPLVSDNSAHLAKLTPDLRALAEKHLQACADKALRVRIIQSLRTVAEQEALFAQGREPLESTNAKRKAVGWAPIEAVANAHKVTWTMQSRHLPGPDGLGRAYDLGLFNTFGEYLGDGKAYADVAKLGKALGLECGYYWKKQDPGHFQLDPL